MGSASRSTCSGWPQIGQRWRRVLLRFHGILVLAMLLAFLTQPQAAMAASLTVTTTTDSLDAAGGCPAMTIASLPGPDGVVSLREAICAANNTAGADTITFGVNGTFPITRLGEDDANDVGDFDLKSNITITGNGAANTIIDGGNNDRVFDTFGCGACTINISGVTITRGNGNSTNGSVGGGMYIDGGVTVSISNSTVSNSTSAAGGGGGINNNAGILTLNNVTLSGNSTLAQGGGLRNSGKLTITNSTFSNNSADEGGGLWTSTFSGDAVSITSSTFQSNTTVGVAGGISGDGAGLYIGGDAVYSLSASTISGNTAGRNGGGVFLRDDAGSTVAATTITNNTISGNSAKGNGGGVYHDSGSNTINNTTIALNISNSDSTSGGDGGGIYALTNSLTVRNSIVSGNSGLAGARPDCGGIFTSGGYNLFGDSTQCPATTGDTNLVTLGKTIGQVLNTTLANNGGPTLTHALLGGSPAIDTGNNATCASTDQRGVARPFGAACDKGSFEVNDTTPPDTTITVFPPNPTNDNTPTFQFTGSDNLTPVASLTYECQIDSGAYAVCASPFTSGALPDGSHTFRVRAKDQAGNIDPTPASYSFVVDTVAPTSTFTGTPANPTNLTTATFAFTGNDGSGSGTKRIECSLDGAAFATCTSPQNLTGLAEGNHTFQVRAVDNAGNTETTPASYTWIVDLTAPDTTITANPPALSNSTTANFQFTGSDPTSGGVASGVASFRCSLDGGAFATCTSPLVLAGLADGAHTFAVRAIDAAGNVDATPASYTWTVDSTSPAAPVVITPANGSTTNNPQPPVTGTAEPNSTVTVFIDGTAVGTTTADASGNWSFTPGTPLSQGAHTVKARAADAAGNTSPDSNTNTFTVDTVEPDTTFTSTPPAATNSTSANFQFTGNGTGSAINHFECSLDGAAFATCTSPQNLTGLAEGSHAFRVRAVDNAGNTETTPASYTWIVDLTAPDTTITANPPALSNSQNASFSFTGNDGSGSGVASFECALDGGAFSACSSPATYTGLADGAHTFAVRAIDAAGNVDATPASYTWTIDTAAPDTTISANPPALSNSQSASFSFTGSDGSGSGVASFECSLDGAAFATCTSPATYTGLADGAHTFAVRAIDAAGNVDATPASYTWTVEAVPPDTTITSTPAADSNSSSASFSFTGSDNATPPANLTFECSLDGATFAVCTSPANYTGLADGSHTFQVRAIDEAGNVDASPASYTWTVDTAPPDTTILSMPAASTNSVTATFTFTGTDATTPPANLTFECSLDGAAFAKCSNPANYTGLADGSHTFQVRAVDQAGNVDATPASYTWTIDTTPVAVTVDQATSQADPATIAPISFTVVFNKPVTGFGDNPGDIDLSGGTAPGTLSAAVSGGPSAYTVMVSGMTGAGTVQARIPAGVAADAFGNSNSSSTSTDNVVTFSPTTPVVTGIVRVDASPTNAATVQFKVTFSEPVTGVAAKDFQLVPGGVSGATITSVSGSGDTWIVTVGAGSNDGTLGLNLVDDDTITGVSSGIVLGGTGAGNANFTSEVYQFDRTPPAALLDTVSPAVRGAPVLTFTVTFSDNLAVNAASLAGAITVTGPNGYNQQATLLSTTPTTDGTPLRAIYQLSAPGGTWDGADNGTYTIATVAGQARDTAGNTLGAGTLGTFAVAFAGNSIYLPLVAAVPVAPSLPDLVVDRITLTSSGLAVVIRNQGKSPVADPFWIDLYINPTTAPTHVGQTWQMLGSQGMAWGVTTGGLPLAPGATLTLTVGDAFFHADLSQYPARLAAGTPIFVQVDSASTPTGYGAILETHEYSGGTYNNISSATVPAGGVPLPAPTSAMRTRADMDLPQRPTR